MNLPDGTWRKAVPHTRDGMSQHATHLPQPSTAAAATRAGSGGAGERPSDVPGLVEELGWVTGHDALYRITEAERAEVARIAEAAFRAGARNGVWISAMIFTAVVELRWWIGKVRFVAYVGHHPTRYESWNKNTGTTVHYGTEAAFIETIRNLAKETC